MNLDMRKLFMLLLVALCAIGIIECQDRYKHRTRYYGLGYYRPRYYYRPYYGFS